MHSTFWVQLCYICFQTRSFGIHANALSNLGLACWIFDKKRFEPAWWRPRPIDILWSMRLENQMHFSASLAASQFSGHGITKQEEILIRSVNPFFFWPAKPISIQNPCQKPSSLVIFLEEKSFPCSISLRAAATVFNANGLNSSTDSGFSIFFTPHCGSKSALREKLNCFISTVSNPNCGVLGLGCGIFV